MMAIANASQGAQNDAYALSWSAAAAAAILGLRGAGEASAGRSFMSA
jgi:hypothetical protein